MISDDRKQDLLHFIRILEEESVKLHMKMEDYSDIMDDKKWAELDDLIMKVMVRIDNLKDEIYFL